MKMYTFMKPNKPSNGAAAGSPRIPSPAPNWAVWVVNIGLLAIAVAALLPILRTGLSLFPWIYACGAAMVLVGRIATARIYKGCELRVRRLGRMELWTAIMFAVATFFIFYQKAGQMDWLAFTLAGAVLQTYSSIMIPRELKKSR